MQTIFDEMDKQVKKLEAIGKPLTAVQKMKRRENAIMDDLIDLMEMHNLELNIQMHSEFVSIFKDENISPFQIEKYMESK